MTRGLKGVRKKFPPRASTCEERREDRPFQQGAKRKGAENNTTSRKGKRKFVERRKKIPFYKKERGLAKKGLLPRSPTKRFSPPNRLTKNRSQKKVNCQGGGKGGRLPILN